MPSISVALFDMDRTLVDTHTAKLYIRFQRELREIGITDVMRTSYWLMCYTFGVIDAERVATRLLEAYRGKPEAWLRQRCQAWFASHVRSRMSDAGRARVSRHQHAGHHVAIATSAVRQVAAPLAEELGIVHLVCSELEVSSGELTGSFAAPLCYGVGKRERAAALVASLGFDLEHAAFYTDSITDLPLLEAVGQPVAVNPDMRLRRVAKSRGWPIEEWLRASSESRWAQRSQG